MSTMQATAAPASPETQQQLENAKAALKKLPMLGPALWLYARDDRRKFTFLADQDWLVMPPLVLDQCRLYTKQEVPWAFFTWAFVNDAVEARLKSNLPKIAPHEWRSGEHVWLIDIVAPFGGAEPLLEELRKSVFAGKAVKTIVPQADGRVTVKEWPAVANS